MCSNIWLIFVIKMKCSNKRPNRFITIKSTKLLKAGIVLSVERMLNGTCVNCACIFIRIILLSLIVGLQFLS